MEETYVFTTDDWAALIANSRPHKPFTIVRMSSRDFIDIDQSLKAYVCVRKKTESGEPVHFQKVMSFKHVSTEQYKITLKSSHGPLQNEQVVDYKVRRRQQGRPSGDLASAALMQKYSGPVCIKKVKCDDLMKILRFVQQVHHCFFKHIPVQRSSSADEQQMLEATGIDVSSNDEEEDEELQEDN